MVFPYWLPSEGDDAEPWPPVDPPAAGEAELVLGWAGDGDSAVRRSVDEWIVERAAIALARDPLVRGRRLEVEVQNGVVILVGVLASAESRDAAGRRAWTVEGVADVCNRITVSDETERGR